MSDGADPVDVALGRAVRGLRKQRGLSQTELGDRLGLSFHQIRNYERGAQQLNLSTLVRIARVLECRSSDLVALVDQAPASTAPRAGGEDAGAWEAESAELVRLYAKIRSGDMRRALLQVARAAADRKLAADRSE